jgi:Holliday junction resolvase RusA-like endonuclease
MTTYRFTAPGQPIPKGRPKHMRNGHTYTPERTVNGEANMGIAFRQGIVGYGPPRPGFFKLSCIFYVKRDDADIDNLIKLVMDGLQGIAWINDKQIKALGECEIRIDRAQPRTIVTFEEL